jgi:hypothetical protein
MKGSILLMLKINKIIAILLLAVIILCGCEEVKEIKEHKIIQYEFIGGYEETIEGNATILGFGAYANGEIEQYKGNKQKIKVAYEEEYADGDIYKQLECYECDKYIIIADATEGHEWMEHVSYDEVIIHLTEK